MNHDEEKIKKFYRRHDNMNFTIWDFELCIFVSQKCERKLKEWKNSDKIIQHGVTDLGYFTSGFLGLIVWRMVFWSIPTSPYKHLSFIHLVMFTLVAIRYSSGMNHSYIVFCHIIFWFDVFVFVWEECILNFDKKFN